MENNKRDGNRHLQGSQTHFQAFLKKDRILSGEITENLCSRFRTYLLNKLTGKTPADYFRAFKRVIKCATKEGYFKVNPADMNAKTNPSKSVPEFLEAEEYITLIQTKIHNLEVRNAFLFCLYTGLRFCDVSRLKWEQVKGDSLVTRILQKKTGKPVVITMHPIATRILNNQWEKAQATWKVPHPEKSLEEFIFMLTTHDGCNKAISAWVKKAGIEKYITWKSARLGFSILLQDKNVDTATVALFLGHTTTRYVNEVYKRHRPKDQMEHIQKLPDVSEHLCLN
ncbi:MAG TPA: site-specific integrase [Puia sp.]|nr:site-specific integrase [Puia sp.]